MKQILLINDVVGYGKVGMGAMLPILSYLGVPTYSLPTALVSNTLDYGKFNIQDTTEYIRGTLPVVLLGLRSVKLTTSPQRRICGMSSMGMLM